MHMTPLNLELIIYWLNNLIIKSFWVGKNFINEQSNFVIKLNILELKMFSKLRNALMMINFILRINILSIIYFTYKYYNDLLG